MNDQPTALRLADAQECVTDDNCGWCTPCSVAAELRRLSAVEAELLAMRRVFSEAGCTFDVNYIRRLVRAEAQRDALLEACQTLVNLPEDWIATLRLLRVAVEQARAAIKAVEEGK